MTRIALKKDIARVCGEITPQELQREIQNADRWRSELDSAPECHDAHSRLAAALINLGRYTEAERLLLRVKERWPDIISTYLLLSRLYERQRRCLHNARK